MTIIYSNNRVDGLDGKYANPAYFAGAEVNATLVYTNDNNIASIYKEAGVEVKKIPSSDKKVEQKKTKSKTEPKKVEPKSEPKKRKGK
jgi:hypothetical protein